MSLILDDIEKRARLGLARMKEATDSSFYDAACTGWPDSCRDVLALIERERSRPKYIVTTCPACHERFGFSLEGRFEFR